MQLNDKWWQVVVQVLQQANTYVKTMETSGLGTLLPVLKSIPIRLHFDYM
jgi:hypothetical protein